MNVIIFLYNFSQISNCLTHWKARIAFYCGRREYLAAPVLVFGTRSKSQCTNIPLIRIQIPRQNIPESDFFVTYVQQVIKNRILLPINKIWETKSHFFILEEKRTKEWMQGISNIHSTIPLLVLQLSIKYFTKLNQIWAFFGVNTLMWKLSSGILTQICRNCISTSPLQWQI